MPDAICFLLQTLDSILNVEMVKEKSAEEIEQVMDLNGVEFVPNLCLIVMYMRECKHYLKSSVLLDSKMKHGYGCRLIKPELTCISIANDTFPCIWR